MISLPDLNVSLGVIVVKRIPKRVTLMMLVGRQPWDVNLIPMTYPLDFWIFFSVISAQPRGIGRDPGN